MPVCDFCGKEYPPHLGIKYILKNGKTYNFCSKKCKKQMLEFDKDPRTVKWTKAHRRLKGKE